MPTPPLMLSISGLRGLIGSSLTPLVAARYGAAIGQWLHDPGHSAPPLVVVGRDSRPSGLMVQQAVMSGLLATGCRVTDVGVLSTPGVAIMTEHLGATGGVVITASHNPIQWNGVKVLRFDGTAPPPAEAQRIIAHFQNQDVRYVEVEHIQPLACDDSGPMVHAQLVLSQIDLPPIQKRRLKVVLDSVYGAGGPETALMLAELGVELVHLYAEPTGRFPHPPEPTQQNLVSLGEAVRQHRADIGFAQDPDADRLAVVDENGTYIGEEYTLALAALHVLTRSGGPHFEGQRVLAANLSTSRMIDDLAQRHGATVVRTPVGEAHVAAAMRQHKSVIGGEGNGGVILPAVSYVRDSVVGIALLLEMLAQRGTPLSRIVAEAPAYAIVKDKVNLQPGLADNLPQRLRAAFPSEKIDTQDGARVDWPDRWVHVRASNTEPILRLIAEARDEQTARALIAQVREAIGIEANRGG